MGDNKHKLGEVYLRPGEMFLACEPTIIRTLLGSCVGIAFWSKRRGVGALCHAMLPRCPEGVSQELDPQHGYRYVDYAIHDIGRRLDRLGVDRSEVDVKVFGGADVLLSGEDAGPRGTVGSMNCDMALEALKSEGFRIIASKLRGISGVNIYFNTRNGEVLLRRIKYPKEYMDAPVGAED